jgi:N-acetylmuramoyl-L-alanine amidase
MSIRAVLPFLLVFGLLVNDVLGQDAPRLTVAVPSADTSTFAGHRHRIGAATDPRNRAFINGEEVTVYASGAFVGVVPLMFGENSIELRVEAPNGSSARRHLVVIRPEPPEVLDPARLLVDEASIRPTGRLWLKAGDVLEVSFRGSPGRVATFEVRGMTPRVPMRELDLEESGGVPGRYVGRYVIQPRDEVSEAPIIIRMRGRGLAANSVRSETRVTVAPYDTPRVVEIVGDRPFFNTGGGTDRLGGARLGAIDAGTHVKVDGRVGGQYRVRLSESMYAWLPERLANLLAPETPLPQVLVGSISVRGGDAEDLIETTLARRIPYTVRHESSPNRIIVDLYGAASNTNWVTQLSSADGIEHVAWEQVAGDHYRLTATLRHAGEWGYDVGYVRQSTLRIRVRRPPVIASAERPLEGLTIVVDAGHGGQSLGALGAAGTLEKDVTLQVARVLETRLVDRGARVVMLRTQDIDVPMSQRIDRTLEVWPDLFVSIHANSTGEASDPLAVRGTSTYYRHEVFKPLSDAIYDEMLSTGLEEFGVVGSFNFSLSQFTQFPNVLVETAFVSNPEDEMLLIDPDFQLRMADSIVSGVERFVNAAGELPRLQDIPTE